MTKSIKLSKGFSTLVDDGDYEFLSQFAWYYGDGYAIYAMRMPDGRQRTLGMHRVVLGVVDKNLDRPVDHINGDKLDNRSCNLRLCPSHTHNTANTRKVNPSATSRYKGVSWHGRMKKWQCQIMFRKKNHYLGYFESEEDAARTYDKAAVEFFGEFAKINFP